ncbi:MAG: DivIVA domain-containing protein [Thermoanaerobaculales bacterium]|jgi:cell division initiation protein|nr:DivIVA domain-containing protein [Thermoanaerobaculales bacterium]
MSELSPLDILGKRFAVRFRGYPANEVHEYLTEVAGAVEALTRERGELRQQVHRLEHELASFRQRETALHEALVAAQRSAESTIESARDEGQRIIADGHGLADRLVEEANERARKIDEVIQQLRERRRDARSELIRLVEILQGLVDDDRAREQEERTTPQLALLSRRNESGREGRG